MAKFPHTTTQFLKGEGYKQLVNLSKLTLYAIITVVKNGALAQLVRAAES
jgi:hypothetical protein